MYPLYVILHNIRSSYNVGAILRTADAVGAERVYLSGYTPLPIDRFGRKRGDIAKAALGAEESVPWEHSTDIDLLLTLLKKQGICIVALEQDTHSIPYTSFSCTQPTAVLLGEEVYGIPTHLLALSDRIVEIPMRGSKESLNVSVAAGVLLYHLIS